jgi:hypothetical protein
MWSKIPQLHTHPFGSVQSPLWEYKCSGSLCFEPYPSFTLYISWCHALLNSGLSLSQESWEHSEEDFESQNQCHHFLSLSKYSCPCFKLAFTLTISSPEILLTMDIALLFLPLYFSACLPPLISPFSFHFSFYSIIPKPERASVKKAHGLSSM